MPVALPGAPVDMADGMARVSRCVALLLYISLYCCGVNFSFLRLLTHAKFDPRRAGTSGLFIACLTKDAPAPDTAPAADDDRRG